MNTTLFDNLPGKVRRDHPDTAAAAADSVKTITGQQRRRVYEFIESRGCLGATDIEIQNALDLNPSSQRPRRIELVERGVVTDSGTKRATPSGRSAAVWIASE